MGRYIGIDYGSKRCGIAVTDPGGIIAQPVDTVSTDELLRWLNDYINRERNVEGIVLGKPIENLTGEPLPIWQEIKLIGRRIKREFNIPVYYVDERFTTKWAERQINAVARRRKKELRDRLAAAALLETFLALKNQGIHVENERD